MLLRRLDDLSEKFLETPMVSQDGEALTKKVSAPFLDCSGNGEQLADICRGAEELGAEGFAEESNGVTVLREDRTHANVGGIGLHSEMKLKIC